MTEKTNANPGERSDQIADELVIDGLLSYLHDDDQAGRAKRVERTIDALREDETRTRGARPSHRRRGASQGRSRRRWSVSIAALVVIANVLVLVGLPTQPSALAQVQASIATLSTPGVRRYEVRVELGPAEATDEQADAPRLGDPVAFIDMNATTSVVITHKPPFSDHWVTVGRDGQGEWAVDERGAVTREHARGRFPPWSLDGRTLMVDAIDRVLEQMLVNYDLRLPDRIDDETTGEERIEIIGTHAAGPQGPRPDRVTLLVDPRRGLPTRIELWWDPSKVRDFRPPPRPSDGVPRGPSPREGVTGPVAEQGPPDGMRLHRIVFELAPAPEGVGESWFAPATHAGG